MQIYIKDFKIAILKIVYKFTIDQVSEYFDDPKLTRIINFELC